MSPRIRYFAAAVLFSAAIAASGQVQPPVLSLVSNSHPNVPGDTVTVEVRLTHSDATMPAVSGVGFALRLDDEHLRYLDHRSGTAFGADTLLFARYLSGEARLAYSTAQRDGDGIHGTHVPLTVRFIVRNTSAIRESAVGLEDVQILMTDGSLVEQGLAATRFTLAPVRVWPGDADQDGSVTERDVLMLGHHFGRTGPSRPDRGIRFEPMAAHLWDVPAAAHADVNGDGIVDGADLAGIHTLHQPPDLTQTIGGVVIPPSSAGDRYRLQLWVDADLMGMSASLGILAPGLNVEPPDFGAWVPPATPSVSFVRSYAEFGVLSLAASRIRGSTPLSATETGLSVDLTVTENLSVPVPVVLYRAAVADLTGYRPDLPIRADIRKLVSVDDAEIIPLEVSLEPAYPNPFNPQTLIRYRLSESGPIRLTVHDALGREVRVLADLHQTAGVHRVAFDATGLASGVYICRLESASGIRIRLMTLIH